MDGCVDDQDYNDGAKNDHPIGKLNARYRCLFAKSFHDYPPIGQGIRRLERQHVLYTAQSIIDFVAHIDPASRPS